MATNTLIQKLFGADEVDVGETDAGVSNRQQIETFRCSEAIAAGATVSLDVSQTSNGLRGMVVSEAEGETKGDVVGITAGDALVISSAGKLEKAPSYRTDLGDGTGTTTGTVLVQPVIVAIAMETTAADATSRVFVLSNY